MLAAVVVVTWQSQPSARPAGSTWGGDGWADLVDVEPIPAIIPAQGAGAARLVITPKSGYFVYSDGIELTPPSGTPVRLGGIELPVGEMVPADEPGHTRMKYVDPFEVAVPIDASSAVDGLYQVPVDARLRLCSPRGCQPIRSGRVELVVAVGDAGSSALE